MKVRDLMTQPAVTCRTSDALSDAAHEMWSHHRGALPAVDDDGRVVGMVTDRDICISAHMQGRPMLDILVSMAMSDHSWTCRPDDALEVADHIMAKHQVRRVPVVDGHGRAVGVISLDDMVRQVVATRLAAALAAIG